MTNLSMMLPLPCVLFLAIFFAWPAASATTTLRAELTHVDSGRGFTKRELLSRMAARSTARAASLGASAAQAVTAPVARGSSEYLVHLGIGTPSSQAVALVLDTGSDLIWTQCACTASTCYRQALPVFKPSASGTLGTVSCADPICGPKGGLRNSGCSKDNLCLYAYSYGDKSSTQGTIVEDTFAFSGGSAVPSLRFGCGMKNGGRFTSTETGIAGFGRGPLSLPSQLDVNRFSYCFNTIGDPGSSPVFLGTPDNLGANAQSTAFAPTPSGGTPSFYYLSLHGVTVGDTLLPLSASSASGGGSSGGPIIDSGTSITLFPEAVFQSLREAFVSQVPLPVATYSRNPGLLCFSTAQAADPNNVPVPKLILHLEGADWDIPVENYVLEVEDDNGTAGALLCVVILSAGDIDMTIIGNFQQQNTHIVYDLQANKMLFAPASCDKL